MECRQIGGDNNRYFSESEKKPRNYDNAILAQLYEIIA